MAEKDQGGSPPDSTGVTEEKGPIKGSQMFEILLAREEARAAEEAEPEAPPVEEPEETEIPPEGDAPEAEPDVTEEDQPEEVEEDQPPEDEDALSQTDEDEDPPRIPLKRLNREVARRKDLEERLKRTQERLAQAEAAREQPAQQQPLDAPTDRFPEVTTAEALLKLERDSEDAVDYLESKMNRQPDSVNDDGVEVYSVDGGQQYTREEMGDMLINARRRLRREIPEKRKFLNQAREISEQATKLHSWMGDRTSPEYHQYQAIHQSRPWIAKNDPAGALLVAAVVEGLKVIRERQTPTKAKPPARREVAPSVDTTSSVPKRVTPKSRADRSKVREREIMSKGALSGSDLRDIFLQRELDKE